MNPLQNDSFGSFSNGQGGDLGQPGVGANGQGFSAVPMNNGVVTSGPVVSGPVTNSSITSGPVVLDSNGGRKSRKWVVILIILLLFVVVAGGVFAVWKSGAGNDNILDNSFNRFANYVLFGEDSAKELAGEYEGTKTYEIDRVFVLYDGEAKNNFMTFANKLWRNFYESLSSSMRRNDEIVELKDDFVFLNIYITDNTNLGDAFVKYLDGGVDEAKKVMNEITLKYYNSGSEKAIIYAEMLSSAIDVFASMPSEELANGTSEFIVRADNDAWEYSMNVKDDLKESIFKVYKELREKE